METEFQLFRIETADRAGVVTAISAALANRGVNIDCFAATGPVESAEGRRGNFVFIIEAESDYALVLAKVLLCLEVVLDVQQPECLNEEQLAQWRRRFARLAEDE